MMDILFITMAILTLSLCITGIICVIKIYTIQMEIDKKELLKEKLMSGWDDTPPYEDGLYICRTVPKDVSVEMVHYFLAKIYTKEGVRCIEIRHGDKESRNIDEVNCEYYDVRISD